MTEEVKFDSEPIKEVTLCVILRASHGIDILFAIYGGEDVNVATYMVVEYAL